MEQAEYEGLGSHKKELSFSSKKENHMRIWLENKRLWGVLSGSPGCCVEYKVKDNKIMKLVIRLL